MEYKIIIEIKHKQKILLDYKVFEEKMKLVRSSEIILIYTNSRPSIFVSSLLRFFFSLEDLSFFPQSRKRLKFHKAVYSIAETGEIYSKSLARFKKKETNLNLFFIE